jgi:hypothetical protein
MDSSLICENPACRFVLDGRVRGKSVEELQSVVRNCPACGHVSCDRRNRLGRRAITLPALRPVQIRRGCDPNGSHRGRKVLRRTPGPRRFEAVQVYSIRMCQLPIGQAAAQL